ncbi:MAG: hypothetical protein KF906_06080 [Actinobacteria bacterium]|nr:hypothetical protein [Actinomycetota bacterium]
MTRNRPNTAAETVTAEHFAPWVEWRLERCRRGRSLVVAVNTITDEVVQVDPAEVVAGTPELHDGAFLAGDARPAVPSSIRRPGDGVVWWGADRFARRIHDGRLAPLFGRSGFVGQVVLAVVGLVGLLGLIGREPVQWRATPWEVPVIVVLGLVAMVVHESGHALLTVRHGRRVRAAGMVLHLGSPTFYVDSTDAVLLDRRQRMLQAAAGPWAEWLVTSIVVLVALVLPAGGAPAQVLQRFAVVNTIGILTNLLPFVRLDGSLLLGDLVREPDLAQRTRAVLRRGGADLRRDPALVAYAVADSAVAAVLLASSFWFWWLLFGDLVLLLWHAGPVGIAGLAVAAALATGRLHRVPAFAPTVRRCRFRMERGWRVRATLAFRSLPELAGCDEAALGVVAGRLRRVRPGERLPEAGHVFHRRSGLGAVPAGERSDRRLVFLPASVVAQAA